MPGEDEGGLGLTAIAGDRRREQAMSRFNGDKARFNRERKQNIQRRKRHRALFQGAAANSSSAEAGKKPSAAVDAGKNRT